MQATQTTEVTIWTKVTYVEQSTTKLPDQRFAELCIPAEPDMIMSVHDFD